MSADQCSSPPLPEMYSPCTSATNSPSHRTLKRDSSATNSPLLMRHNSDTFPHSSKRQRVASSPEEATQLLTYATLPGVDIPPPQNCVASKSGAFPEMVEVTKEWYLATESICGMLSQVPPMELHKIPGLDGARISDLLSQR